MNSPLPAHDALASLPPVWPEDLLPRLRSLVDRRKRKIVVLDDDPTGTQTVHETTILTKWSEERFLEEFRSPEPIVYLLTNSRAMPAAARILESTDCSGYLAEMSTQIDRHLEAGDTLVVYTSRKLVRSDDPDESLGIGRLVADALNSVIGGVTVRPRFLVAKGGITSSEVAQISLTTETARVAGQIAPGVPFWTLRDGARFPALPYVVFPGNVGSDTALAEVGATLRNV